MFSKVKQGIIKSDKSEWINYLLVVLLVALSGFPFFTAKKIYLGVGFLLALVVFLHRRKKINDFYLLTILFLVILVFLQTTYFNFFSINSQISLLIRWTFPFLVVISVGRKFPQYYINISYYLVLISFAFFIPSWLIPGFENFLLNKCAPFFNQSVRIGSMYEYSSNILFYTIKNDAGYEFSNFFRNSGPYWEPGAFAGYTIIALLFNLISNRTFINKRNIAFLLGIASTLSTAGFLGLSFLVCFYFLLLSENKARLVMLAAILLLSFYSYTNVEIFNKKITSTQTDLEKQNISGRRSRMISARVDLQDIAEYPIWGRGRSDTTRYDKTTAAWKVHRNNGVTDFAVKYGLPFWCFYFYFIYYSLKKYLLINDQKSYFAFWGLLVVFLIGFAETYFQQSFFIALFYMHLIFKKNKDELVNENCSSNSNI